MNGNPGFLAGFMTMVAVLGASPSDSSAAGPPETAVVSFTIAPGEVGSPAETVTASRRADKYSLTLERKAFKAPKQSETVSLTAAEFEEIWDIVTEDELLKFQPEETPGKAFDYGDRSLRTEVRDPGDKEPTKHETRWTRPIKNQERLDKLVPALAKLAKSKAKAVALDNFVP